MHAELQVVLWTERIHRLRIPANGSGNPLAGTLDIRDAVKKKHVNRLSPTDDGGHTLGARRNSEHPRRRVSPSRHKQWQGNP